jgi:predicted RNase H-like HicB family nuclease
MNTIFSVVVHKEKKYYVAECPEIGTISQGKTIEQGIENLKEVIELYLE